MKINHSQLIEILNLSKGALIVGILAHTDAKAKKTNNPYGCITKIVRAVGFVGADYQKAVIREGDRQNAIPTQFTAESLSWGEWLIPNKVITHKGNFYLRTQSTPGQRNRQPAKVLNYRAENGQYVKHEDIKQFLPVVKESAKQQFAGLNETIFVRTYAFDSIKKIRIIGFTLELGNESDFDLSPIVEKLNK